MKPYGIVYKITNSLNGKSYIGLTTKQPIARFRQHCQSRNSMIGRAINKHGVKCFTLEVICTCFDVEALSKAEIELIAAHGTQAPFGYNIHSGGAFSMPKTRNSTLPSTTSYHLELEPREYRMGNTLLNSSGFDLQSELTAFANNIPDHLVSKFEAFLKCNASKLGIVGVSKQNSTGIAA